MKLFAKNRNINTSSTIAKDRLKLLVVSDRVCCSPQTMVMLKGDIIKAVGKYLPIDSANVTIGFCQSPPVLTANIPIRSVQEKELIHTASK